MRFRNLFQVYLGVYSGLHLLDLGGQVIDIISLAAHMFCPQYYQHSLVEPRLRLCEGIVQHSQLIGDSFIYFFSICIWSGCHSSISLYFSFFFIFTFSFSFSLSLFHFFLYFSLSSLFSLLSFFFFLYFTFFFILRIPLYFHVFIFLFLLFFTYFFIFLFPLYFPFFLYFSLLYFLFFIFFNLLSLFSIHGWLDLKIKEVVKIKK